MTKTASESPSGPIDSLRPQSRQVLDILKENEGDLVTKDTLMQRVWPDTYVTDDSLVQCVADIRRALGADGAKRLRTVPKKGYVLDPDPDSTPAEDTAASKPPPTPAGDLPRWRRPAFLATITLIVVISLTAFWFASRPLPPRADPPTLAVMPFRNESDAELRYLSEGVAEDLIVALSELSDLSVLSSGTTFGLMGQNIRDIADLLSADFVLEGSLRVAGDDLRLTATLANGDTGAAVWAEAWDGGRADILSFQGKVLDELTRVLSVRLSSAERQRLGVRGTDNIEAHDAYLKGRELENYFTRATNLEAERELRHAIRLDPDYALAHAHLSQVMSLRVENNWSTTREADIQAAFDHAERAVELDPRLPFARFTLGRLFTRSYAHEREGAIERAYAEFETATQLDPDYFDAYVFQANILIFDGKAERALPLIEQGFERNPLPPFWYWLAEGMAQFFLGDYERAEAFLIHARDQNPTAPFPHRFLIATLGAAGKQDDAEWAAIEYEALGRQPTVRAMVESASISDPGYLELFADGLRKAGLPEQ